MIIVIVLSLLTLCYSKDIQTLSNYEEILQTHLSGEIAIDFDIKILTGDLNLTFTGLSSGESILLDSYTLDIKEVKDGKSGDKLDFSIEEVLSKEFLGTVLKIPKHFEKDEEIVINIKYQTTEESGSAQFLTPEQTEGKKYPYLFTQSEMTIGRQLLPIQDTPAVKMTVELGLTVVKPLVAVFPGQLQGQTENETFTTYYYTQEVPIPSYLIAFAAGDIKNKSINENITIFTEKEMLEKAVTEFEEMPQFLENCTKYMGDYLWEEYNILVLPKAFPFSGMEIPTLNFIAPSLVAGDKSIVDIVVHEMIHSWSGNLVTNENWSDFWLNEGITMFLQRKILGMWKGEDYLKLDAKIGYSYITDYVEYFGEDSTYTSLHPDLSDVLIDDVYSDIPYEKGFNFVYYLEHLINSFYPNDDYMQIFFKQYFIDYRYKSINVDEFRKYFEDFIKTKLVEHSEEIINSIDWQTWIYSPGYPPVDNDFSNKYLDEANLLLDKFYNNQFDFADEFNSWATLVKTIFLIGIDEKGTELTEEQHKFLGETLGLKNKQNMLISVNYFKPILYQTNSFLEGEENTLVEFLKDCGQIDYTTGLFELYYRRNKTGAEELFKSLEILYHSMALGQVIEEYEKAESEFNFIYLKDFQEKKCFEFKENNNKIFLDKVDGYNESLGIINIDRNIYLVSKNNANNRIPLNCTLSKEEKFCQFEGKLTEKEEYFIYVDQSITTAAYSIPLQESSNILKVCEQKTNVNDSGSNTTVIVVIVIISVLVLVLLIIFFIKRSKKSNDVDFSAANQLMEKQEE